MATWNELLERNQYETFAILQVLCSNDFRKYADTTHKAQPYLSELSKPLPQFFICTALQMLHVW
jgi:carbonic anhydrase